MDNPSPKILITGATGFVGQALCKKLCGLGFDIQILLRDPADFNKIPLQLASSYILGSLDEQSSLIAACANCDVVIHLAGHAHVNSGHRAMEVNREGTGNLLQAAIDAGVKRLVYLSSTLAHAAATKQGDVTAYGKSKLAAEQLLESAREQSQIEVMILRSVNVYGPGMKGNIAAMISMIDRGRLPRLPEIHNSISLISADDLAQALILSIDSDCGKFHSYTLSDGETYSISEMEQAIYAALDKPMPGWRTPHMVLYAASVFAGLLSTLPGRNGSISGRTYRNLCSDNLFSNKEAVEGLGFEPTTSFYQQLPDIVKQIRESAKKR